MVPRVVYSRPRGFPRRESMRCRREEREREREVLLPLTSSRTVSLLTSCYLQLRRREEREMERGKRRCSAQESSTIKAAGISVNFSLSLRLSRRSLGFVPSSERKSSLCRHPVYLLSCRANLRDHRCLLYVCLDRHCCCRRRLFRPRTQDDRTLDQSVGRLTKGDWSGVSG